MLDKPARRLCEEVDEDEYDGGGEELDADEAAPLCLAFDEEEAVADEVVAGDTCRLQTTFDRNPAATALGLSVLGLQRGTVATCKPRPMPERTQPMMS